MPLNFQVGLAMEIVQSDMHRLTIAMDAIQPTDNTESLNLGTEYGMKEWLFLRFGYRNLFLRDTEEGFTFGAGVNFKFLYNLPIQLDYAYADFSRLLNIQCISLAIEL